MRPHALAAACATLVLVAFTTRAGATCGSDMCALDPRGPESAGGRYSIDVNYQYVHQDQVRVGTERGTIGQVPGHHNEVLTHSRIWSLTGRASVTDRLVVSAMVPFVQRKHVHETEHHEGGFYESHEWDFSGLGDVQVNGAWSVSSSDPYALTLQLGVKAPSGRRNVAEVDGEQPEPMARPSTGSYDAMLGAQVRRTVGTKALGGETLPVSFSLGVAGRINGRGTDDYRMGNEVAVHLAGGWALAPAVTLLGQVNTRFRGRDEAGRTDTEPANTGGTAIYASPGIRLRSGAMAVYGYYQARLHEQVNGIQITAPSHLMFGVNYAL